MITKLLGTWSLKKAFVKGFKEGSKVWRFGFFFVLTIKIIKFLFSRAKPKVENQYDLDPGEYKLVVTGDEKVSKSNKKSKKDS